MANVIFPAGTTATMATITGASTIGSATAIAKLKSIGASKRETKFGNVQGVGDSEVMELPTGVADPGEVEVVVFIDDTDPATNFVTIIKTAQAAQTKKRLVVDLPGAWDATTKLFGPYDGFIKDTEEPEIAPGDEALTFKFTMRRSSAYFT